VNPIELDGVTRRFGELTAVDRLSLVIGDGEIVGLLGHNGAGKTTLIRVVNGLLPADEGSVQVLGRDPFTEGQLVRRSTGVLTEYPALDVFLSVVENLEVYAGICGIRPEVARPRIDDLLHQLGLADKRDVSARDLSAGLKQRVALARALVHDPAILLLDEPTTNMDPVAAKRVRDLIVRSARVRGRTVLLSTHNLVEAESICDRVAIVRNGRLLTVGPPTELRRSLGSIHGVRIETGPDEVDALVAALEGLGPVTRHADASVEVAASERPVPEIVAAVVRAGVPVHRVEPLEPSLEDLYVQLHARSRAGVVA
jgi:ABC-2 type transport system ATP-binding protein